MSATSLETRWQVMPDTQALVNAACEQILANAKQAIEQRGVFRIVLAGGGTPQAVYRQLVHAGADWARWQVYFGDERCLPPNHPERNSVMAMENWLAGVAIPQENIHVIPAERGAAEAAHVYTPVIDAARPFDLVLLGMGEDGHTASLFPGQRPQTTASVLAVQAAPKPPAERVSLGEAALNDARTVLLLVTGHAKHAAVERWKQGEDLPVARIHGRSGAVVYLDSAAATGVQGV
ncbi:MAG: 6-phosphogluconolactonase [Gammaproteobacteria bacterium]